MDAELQLFLWSILYGVGIMFFYDLIRSVRNVFKHGKILITVGDFLFWIGIGIFVYCKRRDSARLFFSRGAFGDAGILWNNQSVGCQICIFFDKKVENAIFMG